MTGTELMGGANDGTHAPYECGEGSVFFPLLYEYGKVLEPGCLQLATW